MKTQFAKPIILFSTLLIMFATLSSSVHADDFGIQIGAYKTLSEEALEQASVLGNLHTVKSGSLTRILVGNYSSRKEAQANLGSVKDKGYTDAFVTTLSGSTSAELYSHEVAANHGSPTHGHKHLPNHINAKLRELSSEELSRTVLLDGKLHFKEGDRFIPVD